MSIAYSSDSQQLSLPTAEEKLAYLKILKCEVPFPSYPMDQLQLGRRIKKKFGCVEYYGTIEYVHGSFLSIIYDDGDEEAGGMLHDDFRSIEFVDSPKRIKGTKAEQFKANCLFGLQGLDRNDYQKQSLIPGISCNHLTLHVLEFYLFTYERQRMWQRKTQNPQNTPYSQNPRMSRHSFCNIYRELDRGTVFFKASILELFYSDSGETRQRGNVRQLRPWNHKEWTKQVLWRSYMYRLVNRVKTFENIQFAEPTQASLETYIQRARVYRDEAASPFFTGAHNVSGFEHYVVALQYTLKHLDTTVDDLCAASTSRDKLAVLRNMKLVGDFFAWQILCDMETCGCLKIDFNFCMLGPGAKNGLDLIFPTNSKLLKELKGSEKYLQLTRILTALQENAYHILGLEFPYFDGKRLGLKEIEHTLCEYCKYKCSKGMHMYHPGEKFVIAMDCFSCDGENPEHGYYCDLCNFFCCGSCLENACDHNDYSESIFVCPPCRQLESFVVNS